MLSHAKSLSSKDMVEFVQSAVQVLPKLQSDNVRPFDVAEIVDDNLARDTLNDLIYSLKPCFERIEDFE